MLSRRETVALVRVGVQAFRGGLRVGLLLDGGPFPDWGSGNLPICREAFRNRQIRRICERFYSDLREEKGAAECPYGCVLRYWWIRREPIPVFLLCCVARKNASTRPRAVTQLGRTAKKRAAAALAVRDNVGFEEPPREFVDYVRRLADTVLAGCAATSMRALTHQMMTPLQGALADVGQLPGGDTTTRLANNLEKTRQLAIRARFLLSEDLNVIPNRIRKVCVHRQVKKICDDLGGVASEKYVELHAGFNSGPLEVEAVPNLLELVLSGLIENAVKYSFRGLRNNPKEVRICYGEADGFLDVMISNLGCLVTQEEIQSRKIFEMNCRGKYSNDRGRDGTGIGLYLVEKITRAHEGEILVESCRKDGGQCDGSPVALTVFTLRWPVYSPIRDRCGE